MVAATTTPPTTASIPTWVRIGLIAIGLPNAVAGLWAVVSPSDWYERFPGWDPRLVSAEPPYNAHLATDAGAGLLASGVVLLVAAWLADRRSTRLATVAFAAFAIPHAAWHAANPADALTAAQDAQNIAVLVFVAIAAVALFLGAGRARPAAEEATGASAPATG